MSVSIPLPTKTVIIAGQLFMPALIVAVLLGIRRVKTNVITIYQIVCVGAAEKLLETVCLRRKVPQTSRECSYCGTLFN